MDQEEYWERQELKKRRPPTHPAVKAYVLSRIKQLIPYVDFNDGTRLLDVGCGNGFFTFYFDQVCDVSGVDYSEKMLKMNPVKKTFRADASDLPFQDSSFDVVFCHALLHHVEHVDDVIQEMKRVSARLVVILEPNRNNPLMFLFSLLVPEERKALRFSLRYLKGMVERNKLQIIASFSFGLSVPNRMPAFVAPLARLFDFKHPLGMTNFIIAAKNT